MKNSQRIVLIKKTLIDINQKFTHRYSTQDKFNGVRSAKKSEDQTKPFGCSKKFHKEEMQLIEAEWLWKEATLKKKENSRNTETYRD